MNLPFESTDDIVEMSERLLEPFPDGEYPNLVEFLTEHAMKPRYDYADEFEHGLDLILDGGERERDKAGRPVEPASGRGFQMARQMGRCGPWTDSPHGGLWFRQNQ